MATGDKKTVVMQADRAIPNGVATLDESGVLDSLQWPDIDDFGAADRVLSNLTDPAKALSNIGAKSNENLLDNWYFADPIDQRGGYVVPPDTAYYISSGGGVHQGTTDAYYTVTGFDANGYPNFVKDGITYYVGKANIVRGYTGTGYTIDGWKLQNIESGGAVLIENNGIRILHTVADNGWSGIIQFFENFDFSKKFIVSALTDKGLLTVSSDSTTGESNEINGCILMNASAENGIRLLQRYHSEPPLIIAVKLELGTVQTLAHQDEDGNWVLNDPPPNKVLELMKCQRYYQLFSSADKRPENLVDYRPAMRANPATGTIGIDGTTYYYADANL